MKEINFSYIQYFFRRGEARRRFICGERFSTEAEEINQSKAQENSRTFNEWMNWESFGSPGFQVINKISNST